LNVTGAVRSLKSTFTIQGKLGIHDCSTFLPLAIITFLAWAVFWIDLQNLGPHLDLEGVLFLTRSSFKRTRFVSATSIRCRVVEMS